jgi:glycine/D-amino acid oxidase-like deaminating enzyme
VKLASGTGMIYMCVPIVQELVAEFLLFTHLFINERSISPWHGVANFMLVVLLWWVLAIHVVSFNSMKNIAVIGGGYGGLASSFNFAKIAKSIHVFDPLGPGCADGSSASAGIMHPMATTGKPIWKGMDGFKKSMQLLKEVQSLSDELIFETKVSILRQFSNEKVLSSWKKEANLDNKLIEMIDNNEYNCLSEASVPVMRIKNVTIVNSAAYLRGLWKGVQLYCKDAIWHHESISSIADLQPFYDLVIVASGPGTLSLLHKCEYSKHFDNKLTGLCLVRGQNIMYSTTSASTADTMQARLDPAHVSNREPGLHLKPEYPRDQLHECKTGFLNGEYVIPVPPQFLPQNTPPTVLAGASHEHITVAQYMEKYAGASRQQGDTHTVDRKFLARVQRMYPALAGQQLQPVRAVAGTRAVPLRCGLGRLPVVDRIQLPAAAVAAEIPEPRLHPEQIQIPVPVQVQNQGQAVCSNNSTGSSKSNVWVIAGFGSRGLLYHALAAEYLFDAVQADDRERIPQGFRLDALK